MQLIPHFNISYISEVKKETLNFLSNYLFRSNKEKKKNGENKVNCRHF